MPDSEAYWRQAARFRELAIGLDLEATAALILLAEEYEGLAREIEAAPTWPLSRRAGL